MELIRFLFANIGHYLVYYHLVNIDGEIEGTSGMASLALARSSLQIRRLPVTKMSFTPSPKMVAQPGALYLR